jgi:hypothetical protein
MVAALLPLAGLCFGESYGTAAQMGHADAGWAIAKPLPSVRQNMAVASDSGRIYVIGGEGTNHRPLSSTEVYDESAMAWSQGPPLPVATYFFAATSVTYVNGGTNVTSIFAGGGCTGDSCPGSAAVYEYLPGNTVWKNGPSMSTARIGFGMAALGGKVYAVGGSIDFATPLSSAEVLDPVANKWSPIPSMSSPRQYMTLAASDTALFALGGYDGVNTLTTVETYSTSAGAWSMVTPMGAKRDHLGAGVLNGLLYAVGGYAGGPQGSLRTTEVFNISSGTWKKGPSMLSTRDNYGLAVGSSGLYAIGGYGSKQNDVLRTVEVLTA